MEYEELWLKAYLTILPMMMQYSYTGVQRSQYAAEYATEAVQHFRKFRETQEAKQQDYRQLQRIK